MVSHTLLNTNYPPASTTATVIIDAKEYTAQPNRNCTQFPNLRCRVCYVVHHILKPEGRLYIIDLLHMSYIGFWEIYIVPLDPESQFSGFCSLIHVIRFYRRCKACCSFERPVALEFGKVKQAPDSPRTLVEEY